MPTLRAVLEKLPIDDLKALADTAGVEVADKRKGSALADALEALDPAHLRVLLSDLPRAALKAMVVRCGRRVERRRRRLQSKPNPRGALNPT